MSESLSSSEKILCKNALRQCDEFNSNEHLKTVFDTNDLKPYQGALPVAQDVKERISLTISYLLGKSHEGRPLLSIFLEELKANHSEEDQLCKDLTECISCIEMDHEGPNTETPEVNMTDIPFVIAAMTRAEAVEVKSGKAFDDPNAYKNDCEQFHMLSMMLEKHKIGDIVERYGERREEWKPVLASQNSNECTIKCIIIDACKKINELSMVADFRNRSAGAANSNQILINPVFRSSEYFSDADAREELEGSGVVLIIDDLSFFHPVLHRHLNGIISNDHAAIIVLSTLRGRDLDRPFYDLIENTIKNRLEKAYRRYCNKLDPKCEIGVDDLRSFYRWLSVVLHEEAKIEGGERAHPKSQKIFKKALGGEDTSTRALIVGSFRKDRI
jgi:hypothetical protein